MLAVCREAENDSGCFGGGGRVGRNGEGNNGKQQQIGRGWGRISELLILSTVPRTYPVLQTNDEVPESEARTCSLAEV